jgi:hypothetical protein
MDVGHNSDSRFHPSGFLGNFLSILKTGRKYSTNTLEETRVGKDIGVVEFSFLARPTEKKWVPSVKSLALEQYASMYFFSPAPKGPPEGVSVQR